MNMSDSFYCYPGTDVLINKLDIHDSNKLEQIEEWITYTRITEMEKNPIKGNFDFQHLKDIHRYIFGDIYEWAGKTRLIDISKGGSLFCKSQFISNYANEVFTNYYSECKQFQNNRYKFINALAKNYADLNALHPFREGNGRTQREFARLVCLDCGYIFDLSRTKHSDMLQASIISLVKGDNSMLESIFLNAVKPIELPIVLDQKDYVYILSSDDLSLPCIDDSYINEWLKKCEYGEKKKQLKKEKSKKQGHSRSYGIER